MGDTEIRRVMRVVYNAVEQVREAYTNSGAMAGPAPTQLPADRRAAAVALKRNSPGRSGALVAASTLGQASLAALEKAGQTLWTLQGLLVSETPERFTRRFHEAARDLRNVAAVLRRAGQRDLADTLTDAADSIDAVAEISQLSLEAGLVG